MNENSNTIKKSSMLVPIMSIAIFVILIFSAGYAYFSLNTSIGVANGNISLPARPSLECTGASKALTVDLANMVNDSTKVNTIAGTVSPTLTCNCVGSGRCLFSVTTSSNIGTLLATNEVIVTLTSNNTTACAGNAAHQWAAGTLTSCNMVAGSKVLLTEKIDFYNRNVEQGSRGGVKYVFNLTAGSASFVPS